jgi:hypothetical protein
MLLDEAVESLERGASSDGLSATEVGVYRQLLDDAYNNKKRVPRKLGAVAAAHESSAFLTSEFSPLLHAAPNFEGFGAWHTPENVLLKARKELHQIAADFDAAEKKKDAELAPKWALRNSDSERIS